jgi:hypothetical protein
MTPRQITIGGKPYSIAWSRRALFRLAAYPKFSKERNGLRQLCIMLHCAIKDEVIEPEDIAEQLTDAEMGAAADAVGAMIDEAQREDAPDPLSKSGRSASDAATSQPSNGLTARKRK